MRLLDVRVSQTDIHDFAAILAEVPGLKSWFLAIDPELQQDLVAAGILLASQKNMLQPVRPAGGT